MILGRWTELKGYRGATEEDDELLWNYDKNPDNSGSVFTIYHALMKLDLIPINKTNKVYDKKNAAEFAL